MFVHNARVRSVKLTGVPGFQSQAKEFPPFTLLAGELFKIRGGKIHEIEAFGTSMPNGIPDRLGVTSFGCRTPASTTSQHDRLHCAGAGVGPRNICFFGKGIHHEMAFYVSTIAVSLLVLGAMTTGTAQAAGCNRACLQNLLTTYIDAMVAHSPSQLPVAANVRFIEDSQELKLGDGLWKTVTGKGNFQQDYIDQRRQIAATHVELFEGGTRIFYSVALHVAKRKIGGIETIVYRVQPDAKSKPDQLGKPLPGMNDPVPAGKGMSRADMVRIAMIYKEGLRIGGLVKANTPFARKLTASRMASGLPRRVRGQPELRRRDTEDALSSGHQAERRRGGRTSGHRAAVDEFWRHAHLRPQQSAGDV